MKRRLRAERAASHLKAGEVIVIPAIAQFGRFEKLFAADFFDVTVLAWNIKDYRGTCGENKQI